MEQPHAVETHEQFLQRASLIFPVVSSQYWTAFQRAVFNFLLAKLIYRYGYADISEAMLNAALVEMEKIVRHCPSATSSDRPH